MEFRVAWFSMMLFAQKVLEFCGFHLSLVCFQWFQEPVEAVAVSCPSAVVSGALSLSRNMLRSAGRGGQVSKYFDSRIFSVSKCPFDFDWNRKAEFRA